VTVPGRGAGCCAQASEASRHGTRNAARRIMGGGFGRTLDYRRRGR
jgi:hypothetical protein